MDHQVRRMVHNIAMQAPPPLAWQPSRPDWSTLRCSEFVDSQRANGFRREAPDHTYSGSGLGCARCLVWAIVFEALLFIAICAMMGLHVFLTSFV